MDAKTRNLLIVLCVLGFLLTSTYTWGMLSGLIELAVTGMDKGQELAQWSVAWILAHLNAFVPLIFVGVIIWLVKQKTAENVAKED